MTEETITRGLITKRGSEHFFSMSAVMISSLYWGLGHLGYLLDATSWYPVMWFVQAFIIGIVLAIIVIIRKRT